MKFGDNRAHVKISYNPFVVELYVDGTLAITANDRGLFNFEQLREKPNTPAPPPPPPQPVEVLISLVLLVLYLLL